jgi:hypothetical protein
MRKSLANPVWVDRFILVGAGLFIFALVVSAIFDPTIRILHAFQTLIYIAVIVLTRRGSAWGFGAGCIIAASGTTSTFSSQPLSRAVYKNSQGFFRRVNCIDLIC